MITIHSKKKYPETPLAGTKFHKIHKFPERSHHCINNTGTETNSYPKSARNFLMKNFLDIRKASIRNIKHQNNFFYFQE